MRDLPEVKQGCLPEMRCAVVTGVALDEKFYVRCSILDDDDRSWGPEIDHIPCRLVLSLFAFFTNIPNNSLTASSFQFHRKLQEPFRSRGISVH
jgi:hypothetical protein